MKPDTTQALRTPERITKYVSAVKDYMLVCGHATNADILSALRQTYPDLSATTVHRITARLTERGELLLAPPSIDNSMRFDANVQPHDHFSCLGCGMLRDADIQEKIRPIVEASIGDGCSISGRLMICGYCKRCDATSQQA
jgi:Fur family transcriptional regulator, peroxide stress response regulator